jgi:hypothetical protein
VPFRTERALVDALVRQLRRVGNPWGRLRVHREFFYLRGRTDVVALMKDGTILAFEAKLSNWRKALHQAYRNSCFAHVSFVLLPEQAALSAHRYAAEFECRRVGLCYVSSRSLVVLQEAARMEPLQPWLTEQVTARTLARCR